MHRPRTPMRIFGALLVVGVAAGCSGPARTPRVAVLPVQGLGLPDGEPARLRGLVIERMGRVAPGAAVDSSAVDAAIAAIGDDRPCAREPGCPRRVGRRVGASQVISISVASLARTHLVVGRLIPTDASVAERELSETILGGPEAVTEAVRGLPGRFFPPPPAPWYRRWWVWAGASGVVAAGVVAGVLVSGAGESAPDLQVQLP